MDEEEVQKGYVVATEGYMEDAFNRLGIIPNMYLYKDRPPEIFKDTNVVCRKYDGMFTDAVEKVYEELFKDVIMDSHDETFRDRNKLTAALKEEDLETSLHVRVLGISSLEQFANDEGLLVKIREWTDKNIGISLVYEGSAEVPHPVFPIWKAYTKDKELKQVKPSFGKQVLNFGAQLLKEAGATLAGQEQVSEEEYLRRWNTCLTCPALVYYENSLRCGHCGCTQKTKCNWKSAVCSDPEDHKW
jgi:hypothetical protein